MVVKLILHPRNNWLNKCGYSTREEAEIYDHQLNDILENTRWYLDNFETMSTYRLSWVSYTRVNISPRFCHKQQAEPQQKRKKNKVYK
jgi:hypothetical protein